MTNNISPSLSPSLSSTSSSDGGFFDGILDGLKEISITTWIIVILILAFLGFNVFVYLAKGTQDISNIFGPIVAKIAGLFAALTGQVTNVSAEGAKQVVNVSAATATTGLSAVQDVSKGNLPNTGTATSNAATTLKTQAVQSTMQQPDIMANNTLHKSLNTAQSQQQQGSNDYEADESSSNIQGGVPKAGWCYIGEDRGFRSCAKVGVNDTCMSGDIFPSHEICVNPSLRA
jgi:hypothetical protein